MTPCNCGSQTIDVCTPSKPLNDTYNYNNLRNKATINDVIVMGTLTSADLYLYGKDNPETYVHKQTTAAEVWHITHNLQKFPSISVVDSAGTIVVGEITYIDDATIDITFSGAFSGTAYLN